MKLDRRQVLAGMGGLALGGIAVRSFAQTRITLGAREVISISDGHLVLPGAFFFEGLMAATADCAVSVGESLL